MKVTRSRFTTTHPVSEIKDGEEKQSKIAINPYTKFRACELVTAAILFAVLFFGYMNHISEEKGMDETHFNTEEELNALDVPPSYYPIPDDSSDNEIFEVSLPLESDFGDTSPEDKTSEEIELKSFEVEMVAKKGSVQVSSFSTRVPQLGDLLFTDGLEYMTAPNITLPVSKFRPEYSKGWNLKKLHDQYFDQVPHKRYIPRLDEPISKEDFHKVFRKTSTPVIIPFRHMRHLGVITKGRTLQELREQFPYEPKSDAPRYLYKTSDGLGDTMEFGPGLYELEKEVNLDRSKKGNRNYPRNMLIKKKYLDILEVSFPPFVSQKRFQRPALWFGTSTADTRNHHDCCDNFAMMLSGTKRWFISPPTDTRILEPVVCDGKNAALCWANGVPFPNHPNKVAAEKMKNLQSMFVDLQAGEMLYLPAGWYHHVQNLGPTLMINFWTLGCENVALALDNDSERKDRPDFKSHRCQLIKEWSLKYITS